MTDTFPPAHYAPVPSQISGIEVFAPAPEEAAPQPEVVAFSCPQCGANTAYSAANGGLTCTHCGYVEKPKAAVVGTKAAEYEFTVETMDRASQGWGQERKEVECQNCGAITSVPPDSLTHTCPFCASNKVIQRTAVQDNLRPRFLVPFQVDAAKCTGIAREWLGSSWMTPSSLRQSANLGKFTAIYLPFWTFDAVTSASWKAEVAHQVTESYYVNGERRTRMKTVWRWESGNVRLVIDDLIVSGTSKVSRLLLNKMRDYNLGELCPYDPKYLAGLQAQAYDVTLEQAWEIGRGEMREQTREACLSQATSRSVRNFSMNLDFADESWRYLLLPVYLNAYTFEDKVYQVMVNGQTGTTAGQRPVDWTKVWIAMLLILSPGILLGLVGLLTLALGGLGAILGVVGLVLLIIGAVIDVIIFLQAQAMDDA